MKQEGLRYFTDINLTLLGLGIFFFFFAFLLLRVMVYRKTQINYFESLPFNDTSFKLNGNSSHNSSNSSPVNFEVQNG